MSVAGVTSGTVVAAKTVPDAFATPGEGAFGLLDSPWFATLVSREDPPLKTAEEARSA